MKKLVLPLVILLVCAFIITGCSTSSPTPSATAVPASSAPATVAKTASPAPSTSVAAPATSAPAGSPKYGGTFTYVTAQGPGGPFGVSWLASGGSSFGMQFSMNTLLREMADGSITPFLAESYDVVTDAANPSVTLHLRKGVKFSDGTDFNATAVKWNLQQEMLPVSLNVRSTANWKSVEALDDYTVRVNLKVWQNTAVNAFANAMSFMMSPTAYQTKGEDWNKNNMVGTGAFIQTDYQKDVSMTVEKNPKYWETGKPYLDKIKYVFVADASTAEMSFRTGGGNVIQCYTDKMADNLKKAGFKIISYPGFSWPMYPDSMNADSPWSNLKFRQAVEYAINKKAIADTFGYGTWTVADQQYSPLSAAYDTSLKPRSYDVAKAKQLLAEAGFGNGVKTTLFVSPMGDNKNIALAVQSDLAAVGIQAEVQVPQAAAYTAMVTGTWKNGCLMGPGALAANPIVGWTNYAKGSAWFQSMKKPDNFDELYNAAMAAPKLDPALVKKCSGAIFNDVTIIPLFITPTTWAVTDNVQDSGLGTRGLFAWFETQNLWLSK
jgi:peptide/nickel transport system substrate-binding protein